MRRTTLYIVLATSILACGPRKADPAAVDLNRQALESYWAVQPDYRDLSIKTKINVDDGEQAFSLSAKFLLRKDSLFWASFTFMGLFEGARVLITPDSVHMLDHMSHTYMGRHINELKTMLGMDVGLSELQHMIVGSPAFAMPLYQLISTDSVLVIRGTRDHLINTVGITDQLFTYRSAFRSNVQDQTGDLRYSDYREFDGIRFPTEVDARIHMGDQDVKAEMSYSSIDTARISRFAFNIPSSYERI